MDALQHENCSTRVSNFDRIMPKTLATAAVDRLLHHAHVVQADGDSFRLKKPPLARG